MDIFLNILSNMLFLAAGLLGSAGAFWLYNRLPPAWFRDYEDAVKKEADDSARPSPRMKRFPDGVWFCMSLLFVFFLFYIQCGLSIVLFCNLFSVFLFSYVFIADLKTRMIPDQFIVGLLFVSLLFMVDDLSYLQGSGEAWYWGILMRILGGAAGGCILWLVRAIGTIAFKQEALGMGDVKLLFACGLLAGFGGVFWVLSLSFLFAFLPALISMIRGRKSKRNSSSVFSSVNHSFTGKPRTTTRKQLPFAPFVVIATTLYLLFPSEFALLYLWYSRLTF